MTDRIEDKRYQDAIRFREDASKRLDQARRTKAFAEKLSSMEKRPITQPSLPKQEMKPQVKPKGRREEPPEPKKQEPQKAKIADRPKQPRTKPVGEKRESDQFFQFAAQFVSQPQKSNLEVPVAPSMLPSPVLNELIERIYTCAASDGQKTVSIRLKDNVLAGAQIDVSVSDREVKLGFQHTTGETRQLLRASKHLLQSRLAEKKLSLLDFSFH